MFGRRARDHSFMLPSVALPPLVPSASQTWFLAPGFLSLLLSFTGPPKSSANLRLSALMCRLFQILTSPKCCTLLPTGRPHQGISQFKDMTSIFHVQSETPVNLTFRMSLIPFPSHPPGSCDVCYQNHQRNSLP